MDAAMVRQSPPKALDVARRFWRKGAQRLRSGTALGYGRLALLGALWTGLAWFALSGDGKDGYWAQHPMLGSLVSGILLLALAGFVVNALVEQRTARRWDRIAVVGYTELAIETRDALALMWGTHSGPDQQSDPRPLHLELTPGRELKQDLPGKDGVAIFADPKLPPSEAGPLDVLPNDRLERLLQDREWIDFARPHLFDLYRHTQAVTRDCAAYMIWATDPRQLLNYFADFSDAITKVHGALNVLGNNLGCVDESDAVNRERVLSRSSLL
jgi:hypothetical protein